MNQVIINNTTSTIKDLHRFIFPYVWLKTASPINTNTKAAMENETIN